jgi:hypothetical protein
MATRRKSQTSRTKARHRKQKPDTTEMAEANPADAAALDAGEFLNMITGAWVSQITRAVAELHILDHLAETAEDIARIESSDPRTAFRLMRAAQGIARTWLAHYRGSAERGRRRGRNCSVDQLDRGPRDRRRGMGLVVIGTAQVVWAVKARKTAAKVEQFVGPMTPSTIG